jgi:hypothetical protein
MNTHPQRRITYAAGATADSSGVAPRLTSEFPPEHTAQTAERQEYHSIRELAERWRVSRGTVYNRLRSAGAKVLDFAAPGKKGKKVVSVSVVLQIEARKTKKLC